MSRESILKKNYEIISDCPRAMDWESYEFETIKAYQQLLTTHKNDEAAFQRFFEENPSMMPGAFGFFGESGHAPYNNILISQPKLNGVTTRIPDFLWIATDSCTIYPVFVEIERPSKRWFTNAKQPTAAFTQAQTQLAEWKAWFQNPTHQHLFFEFYEIGTEYRRGKSINPYYVLIYGSRDEFQNKPDLNEKRNFLSRNNEIYMTFDRLSPNPKARNVITCKKSSEGYIALNIPPTFRLGPVFANEMSRVNGKEDALGNSPIPDERKAFLISRLEYWDDFGKRDPRGIRSTSDWE